MSTKLLNREWDASGVRTDSYSDADAHDLVITRMQNVQPILEYNAFLRAEGPQHYRGENGDMWHYARIPIMELEKLIKLYGADVVFGHDPDKKLIKYVEANPYLKAGEFNLA